MATFGFRLGPRLGCHHRCHMLDGGLQMGPDRTGRTLGLPGPKRLEDLFVLRPRLVGVVLVRFRYREADVVSRALPQASHDAREARFPRHVVDRGVEEVIQLDVAGVVVRSLYLLENPFEVRDVRLGGVCGRELGGHWFQHATDLVDLDDLVERREDDGSAPVRVLSHDPVTRELGERLTHGSCADAEALGDLVLPQPGTGRDLTGLDESAELLRNHAGPRRWGAVLGRHGLFHFARVQLDSGAGPAYRTPTRRAVTRHTAAAIHRSPGSG